MTPEEVKQLKKANRDHVIIRKVYSWADRHMADEWSKIIISNEWSKIIISNRWHYIYHMGLTLARLGLI